MYAGENTGEIAVCIYMYYMHVHVAQGTIRIDQVYACVDGCVHVHVCGVYMYRETHV